MYKKDISLVMPLFPAFQMPCKKPDTDSLANMQIKSIALYGHVAKACPFVHNYMRKQLINLVIMAERY